MTHFYCLLTCFVIAVPAVTAQSTGTLTGTVRYTGVVPPAKVIPTTDGGTLRHNDLVVAPKTKGLRHVLAVLENAPAQPPLKKAKAILVDQRDMLFTPRVVGVQDGQPVRFENSDLCNHSVLASSTIPANQLNVVAGPNQPVEHVFRPQKGPVMIGCALHAWMRAWVFVIRHPWFAVSDEHGNFRIEGIPAGKYTLLLRHQDTGHVERRQVDVSAGTTRNVVVEWKRIESK